MTNALQVNPDPILLDRIFAAYDRGDAPGLVAGVSLNGFAAYRRGFGLASVERPQPLSPDMRLRIGSVSKHFLCMLLLLLAEEGRLSLDDSPRRYIPELPDWAGEMNLRQLMSHTSGVRCSLDLILQNSGIGGAVTEHAQLGLLCAQTGLNFRPGSAWCYSNGGYVLLSEVAERAGGMPLAELLRRRLFEPAQMRHTLLHPRDRDDLSNCASLHRPAAGGYDRYIFGPAIRGEGGIVSTVDDMLRWMAQMTAPVVGSPASWMALHRPISPNGYGLGLYTGKYRGARMVHHGGNVIGGTCQMIRLPDAGLDVIVIANRGDIDAGALALRVVEACVTGLDPKPAPEEGGALLSADFHSSATGSFVRLLGEDRQYGMIYAGRQPLRLVGTDGTFGLDLIGSDLKLRPVLEGGAVTALDVHECGRLERLQRLPYAGSPVLDRRMLGDYRCDSLDVAAAITEDGGRAVLDTRSPFGRMRYALEVLGPGLCLASTGDPRLPLGGLIEFDDQGFLFSSQRTRRLRFAHVVEKAKAG